LVLVCKYRKKLLTKHIAADIKQVIFNISQSSSFSIDILETDKDHLHMLLNIIPQYSITSIVNRLKSISTYRIWKLHYNYLRQQFWKKNIFWSNGYFVCSIGKANPEKIRRYIDTQG
jgi:putative transposase